MLNALVYYVIWDMIMYLTHRKHPLSESFFYYHYKCILWQKTLPIPLSLESKAFIVIHSVPLLPDLLYKAKYYQFVL